MARERITPQLRASLWKLRLMGIRVGGKLGCTGLDDDGLCADFEARKADCVNCKAMNHMGKGIIPISLIRAGTFRKDRD